MSNDPLNPTIGSLVFNGEEFTYLVDLEPQDMQGKLTEQPGFGEAKDEVLANQQEWGAKAGVTSDDFTQLQLCNERIARIDTFLPPMLKCIEMMTETRCLLEDQRQRIVLNVAKSVDRRSIREPQLLAKYQKTRAYRSANAKKGLKTRKAKQAALTAPASQPPEPTGTDN